MARLARVVGAGLPHHVTQRGNRRQQVFFGPADYRHYLDLLATHCAAAAVEVWVIPGTQYLIAAEVARA
jgi:putative transposase